eukprot:PhM_4_TR18418/c0_g1_i1/m.24700/K01392/THOP1; thimet oligopeptidase
MSFPNVTTAKACSALFPSTVATVKAHAEYSMTQATESLQKIYNAPRTWDGVIAAEDAASSALSVALVTLGVVKKVHPEKEVRDVATEQCIAIQNYSIDHFQCNRELYKCMREYMDKNADEVASLPKDRKYYLDESMASYKRLGLELPDDKFAEVVAMKKQLSELSSQFQKNIAEDKSHILCTAEDLAGVPEDTIAGLKKNDEGKYIVGCDYPTYFAVQKNCKVAETRERHAVTFSNRAFPDNMSLLHNIISKRHKMSQLIGYESYAAMDLDGNMARTVETAGTFAKDLIAPLKAKWAEEFKAITADLPEGVELHDGKLKSSDIAYVMHQYKTKYLNVDENLIKEYFPLDSTVQGLFDTYEAFFDIKFEKAEGVEFWAPEVFAMAAITKSTNQLLGHVILDLFPREGKYSHACCSSVVPSVSTTESPALAVVLANFPKSVEGKPALFMHSDVETFFHEFGHAIHALCGRCEMTSSAAYHVKMDFVELPSQILEEWLWDKDILKKVTRHYKTGEPLPEALIDAKIKAKTFFSGRDTLRQVNFALLSLELYSAMFAAREPEKMNSDAVVERLAAEMVPNLIPLKDTHFQCNFGHLTGYGASYYSYLWAEVFAADVFDYIRSRNGLLDRTLGRRYIECIIGRGGSRDPMEMVTEFLGRAPEKQAFLKSLGI